MPARIFSDETDVLIARGYADGKTMDELAAAFGGSQHAVASALRRQGVKSRPAGKCAYWQDTAEQRAEAVRLYGGGLSVKKTARKMQVSGKVISAVLADAGIKTAPCGRGRGIFTAEQARAVALEYEAGASLPQLAEKYNTSMPTVSKAVRANGVAIRKGGARFWTDEKVAEMVRLHRLGTKQKDIAEQIGTRFDAVSRMLYKIGELTRERPSREKSPNWRGGKIRRDGYVYVFPTTEEMKLCPPNSSGRIGEHRLVMAEALGRPLLDSETVHHINGRRDDNQLSNLQLRQGKHGAGVAMACLDCGSHNINAVPLAS